MTKRQRTLLIVLSIIIVLCLAGPIAGTVLRPPPPTEAQLLGIWSAGEASVTLKEDGTATLVRMPVDEGVTSGTGSWTLREISSEGWFVMLNRGDVDFRLYVDRQFTRTTLIRQVCDPDAPGCSITFELGTTAAQTGATS